jgi:two-component system sensor histidine kinase HydH
MPAGKRFRDLFRYVAAFAASAAALALVSALSTSVGFIPMLLLPAVALVERYAGPGPAILTTAMCSLGSLLFIDLHPLVHERIHNGTQLLLFPAVAVSVLYLMEARRRQKRVVYEQLLELSTLLESMPEAVFIYSRDGRVVNANRPAEELCGCEPGELLGRYFTEIAAQLNVQREQAPIAPGEMAVVRALRGETVISENRTLVHPNRRDVLTVAASASPMRSGDGRVIGALLVVRDLTEITQLQQRIADTERHLAIGQMASGIAHDFNNVLNTITQAVALLELNPERSAAERGKYLEMIDRAARTGAEIIKRVREYIRGGTGERGPVQICELLTQAVDLTEPMWRKRPEIRIVCDLKPVAPVFANGPDLQRVFTNLIINAIQAMPQGGTLTVATEERDGAVSIRIQDTGVGIAPEQQKKIFLPYYTTKTQGTGLGLSTAQKTVLTQGGNISFQSEAGKGTTFTIVLPALAVQQPVAAA